VPEPVRIAFRSFSNIRNPGTFSAPKERLLLQAGCKASVDPKFDSTEWWKIAKGEQLREPFDVGEEMVDGLLEVLEMVCALFYL